MIDGKRVIAIVPARGGSKGVPRKNIRIVDGKPLLAYTIEAAKRSGYFDEIAVSSDDSEILGIAAEWGASLLNRPPQLATDESPGIDPVLHALELRAGYDYVVLLQPTSPLRSELDINGAIKHCFALEAPACVSVCEAATSPFRVFDLNERGLLRRFMNVNVPNRRQEIPPFYTINGAVYVAEVAWLKKNRQFISNETVGYLMPAERSLDVDTELDLLFFEFMARRKSGGKGCTNE